ncbi:hypothetical protein EE612_034753 [Oryza sativa]|nr:hypothetical protein EE612_034753 [Oryza sativa]
MLCRCMHTLGRILQSYFLAQVFLLQTAAPWPSILPLPLISRLSTRLISIQFTLNKARSVEPSRLPSSWMTMSPLHGPVKLRGPVTKSPLGKTIVCLSVPAHAAFHASSTALVLSVFPSPLPPSFM